MHSYQAYILNANCTVLRFCLGIHVQLSLFSGIILIILVRCANEVSWHDSLIIAIICYCWKGFRFYYSVYIVWELNTFGEGVRGKLTNKGLLHCNWIARNSIRFLVPFSQAMLDSEEIYEWFFFEFKEAGDLCILLRSLTTNSPFGGWGSVTTVTLGQPTMNMQHFFNAKPIAAASPSMGAYWHSASA